MVVALLLLVLFLLQERRAAEPVIVSALYETLDQAGIHYGPGLRALQNAFRQLLHVGFKIAAKLGPKYINALEANEDVIAKNVTENLYKRHIKPVFLGA